MAKLPSFVPQEIEVGTQNYWHSATPIDYKTFRVASFLQLFHNINHTTVWPELSTFTVDFTAALRKAQFICLETLISLIRARELPTVTRVALSL